jgi:hypothetical protein
MGRQPHQLPPTAVKTAADCIAPDPCALWHQGQRVGFAARVKVQALHDLQVVDMRRVPCGSSGSSGPFGSRTVVTAASAGEDKGTGSSVHEHNNTSVQRT